MTGRELNRSHRNSVFQLPFRSSASFPGRRGLRSVGVGDTEELMETVSSTRSLNRAADIPQ